MSDSKLANAISDEKKVADTAGSKSDTSQHRQGRPVDLVAMLQSAHMAADSTLVRSDVEDTAKKVLDQTKDMSHVSNGDQTTANVLVQSRERLETKTADYQSGQIRLLPNTQYGGISVLRIQPITVDQHQVEQSSQYLENI